MKPFFVNPRYQDIIEKPSGIATVKVVLFEEAERLREALEFYRDLPLSEQDQLWTQELADKCIDIAKQALETGGDDE